MRIKSFSLKQTVLEVNDKTENIVTKLKSYFNSNHIEGKTLEGNQLGTIQSALTGMDNSEKLRVAKAMSKNIIGINAKVRLFYLKGACIISSLSDKDNLRIVDLLSAYGIKEAGQQYTLEETIVDMLVDTSKKTYVVTEDGLINTEDIDMFDWQYYNIKVMQTLGCELINIWTASKEEAYQMLLDRISQQVGSEHTPIPAKPVQGKLINA